MSRKLYDILDMWVEDNKVYFDFGTIVVILVKDQPLKPYIHEGITYVEVYASA